MIKAILWDYDGTLVDTTSKNFKVTIKIIESITGKSADNFIPLLSHEEYRKANEASANWREMYGIQFGLDPKQVEEAGMLWSQYQLQDKSILKMYNGVYDVVNSLENYYQGIVSQNSRKNILRDLSQMRVEGFFEEVVGYKEVELNNQKPHPEGIFRCLDKAGKLLTHEIIFYIGDHETDCESAANANEQLGRKAIQFIAAMYDKTNNVEKWKVQPDFIVTSPNQILAIITKFSEDFLYEE